MWTTGEKTLDRGAALAVVAFWCLSATAAASFPGHNGSIAYTSGIRPTSIFTIPPNDTEPTRLTNDSTGDSVDPAWSPDGSRIAFVGEVLSGGEEPVLVPALMVMNENGSGIDTVDASTIVPHDPSWAPDGTRLAWTALVPAGSVAEPVIVVKDLDDGESPEPLVDDREPGTAISGVAWSPDGTKIAYVLTYFGCAASCGPVSQLQVVDVSTRASTPLGAARSVGSMTQRGDAAWSPDGKLIAVSFGPSDLRVVSGTTDADPITIVDNSEDSPYTFGSGRFVAWSPDGSQLVFVGNLDSEEEEGLVFTSPTGDDARDVDGPTDFEGGIDWQPLQAPVTKITVAPPAVTTDRNARFEFVPNKRPVTFECRLDDQPWATCASGIEYAGLSLGSHVFAVRATESHGIVEELPPQHTWQVVSSTTSPGVSPQEFPDRTAIRGRWFRHIYPKHWVEFLSLRAVHVPSRVTIDVSCKGPGCPDDFHRQWRTRRARASKRILGDLRDRRLEPRAAVFVTITKPGYVGMGKMYCVRYNRRVRVRPYRLDRLQPTCGPAARESA